LQKLVESKPDVYITDVYDTDAPIIQRQLVELGVTDFSNFYSYALSLYSSLPHNLNEGIKGLNYITAGPRSEVFTQRYVKKFGKIYSDAWAPPYYDAMWIVALAINMSNSLDPQKIRDAMWPAAYHYSGVSGQGDKSFNMYGKQAADQQQTMVLKDGTPVPYVAKNAKESLVTFRYTGQQGISLDKAPTADEFAKLYPAP
jgi:ABC-type branched-subunit amino acid transport system substrate-binding protein